MFEGTAPIVFGNLRRRCAYVVREMREPLQMLGTSGRVDSGCDDYPALIGIDHAEVRLKFLNIFTRSGSLPSLLCSCSRLGNGGRSGIKSVSIGTKLRKPLYLRPMHFGLPSLVPSFRWSRLPKASSSLAIGPPILPLSVGVTWVYQPLPC